MKGSFKVKIIKSLTKLSLGISSSIKRFPITIFYSTSVAIMIIIMTELGSTLSTEIEEMLTRITMTLALGIPLSLSSRVYFERKEEKSSFKLIVYYIFSAIIQLLFYLLLLRELTMVTITRFVGINIVFYLCFIFIPYMLNKKNFELYVINIFTSFLITYVYSAVLYAGLSAILFAIDNLLGIKINSNFYFYTFLIVALFFAPAYFLAYVPKENKVSMKFAYSKILKILLTYIVMPLLTIYTFILYLYFGKIIISMEWPIGLVSHLVLWFSLILTLVLFFIAPIKDDIKWTCAFSKWAPRIILPILIMMFISMGIRINAYGITENRYYVFVLGLWIFGTMIYLSLAKERKNILIPISLSIIILLSILGPISSYSISRYSQSNRLESILINNNLLKDGKIQPSSEDISIEDRQSISSILTYFENNHNLNNLDVLPEEFTMNDMEETFGFSYENPYYINNDYFYYVRDMESNILDIADFDYFIDTRNLYGPTQAQNELFTLSINHNIVSIDFGNNKLYEKDLSDFVTQLHEKYGFIQKGNEVSEADLTLEDENEDYRFKFIINNIGGQKDESGTIKINDIYFYLLVKEKNNN
jgi:hypothetical protein